MAVREVSFPVSPYIGTIDNTPDVVLSLYGTASVEKLRYNRSEESLVFNKLEFQGGESSVDLLAEIGITSVITVAEKFSSNIKCFSVDVLAKAEAENTVAGSLIKRASLGIGFRIGVMAFEIKSDTKISSPGTLSAACTMNMAQSVYQVIVVGAGVEAMPIFEPMLVASTSDFSVQTFEVLGAVQTALEDYIIANSANLTPSLISVTIDLPALTNTLFPGGSGDYLTDILAQTYALERASAHRTLEEALADSRVRENNLNTRVITHVFEQILGLTKDQRPEGKVWDTVQLIICAGRY
jgi:hypothetical protein